MTKNTFLFLFTTGFVLRIFFSFQIPDFTGNDERAHLMYAQHVLAEKKLPNLNNYPKENPAGNEYFQPPVYYLFLAPLLTLTDIQSTQLHIARVFGVLIWAVGFYFAHKLISIIKLRKPHVAVTLAFLALLPTYVANSSTVNNDTLTITLSIITFFYIAKLFNQELTSFKLLALSTLISLTILTKITGVILLPAAIWLIYCKTKEINKKFILFATLILTLVVLLTGWWFTFNFLTYQNFLGPIGASTATFTNVEPSINKFYLILRGTFFTFWASWGPANQIRLPLPIYIFLLALTFFPIFGFFSLYKKHKLPIHNKYIHMFLITLSFNIFLLLIFNIRNHQPLGRYLYPSIFPIALFWSIGINSFLPTKIQKHLPALTITLLLCLNLIGSITLTNYYQLVR